jgi:hypothetical protein
MIVEIRENKQKMFEKMYLLGFGVENTTHTVSDLYIQKDDNRLMAMYTGYEFDKYTYYLQFATRFEGEKDTQEIYDEWLEYIGKRYKYMLYYISNENYPALITNLRFGSKIIGIKKSPDENELFVEMCMDLKRGEM